LFFFFFQAEDGIRDRDVTGVQTCALPISLTAPTGRTTYDESYQALAPVVPTLAATAGYRLTPSLLLNAKFRVASSNVPNFFVGVTYDLENL